LNEDAYINSDELRAVTKRGSSFLQAEKLKELGIPFSFDQYGTPMVKRSDLDTFLKVKLQPLFKKLNLDGDPPA
jgi:hypothetical protein